MEFTKQALCAHPLEKVKIAMIATPTSVIRESLLECLHQFWTLEHEPALLLHGRPLKAKANEVALELVKRIIDIHPLRPIVVFALRDMEDHAEAVDLLGKSRTSLPHVRHVEELYTVTKFLVNHAERYNEFAWRWNNFKTLHAIRNRILNLKIELDSTMKAWLHDNIGNLKSYFHKKFDEDPSKCLGQWEKLSNWLYPISLSEIFEKAGREKSYKAQAYDWNSQSVHFSPLSDVYIEYELEHLDYGGFAIWSVKTHLHKMCSECLPLVADQAGLKDYYFKQLLVEMYGLLCNKPDYFEYLATNRPSYAKFKEEIQVKPHRYDNLFALAVGTLPKDPLLLEFSANSGEK